MTACDATERPQDIRRIFWATQPAAKGVDESCVGECGRPGLAFGENGAIMWSDYVRGLALNILLTNGPRALGACGVRPGQRGGHWSDSFRTDGGYSGATYRYVKPDISVVRTISLIRSFMEKDLQRLVSYGVALSVTVKSERIDRNRVSMVATILGPGGNETNVGITGSRLTNGWAWES